MSCPVCVEKFDHKVRVPIVGKCAHSVCEPCVQQLVDCRTRIGTACPLCKTVNAFSSLKRNFQMLDYMTATEAEAVLVKKVKEEQEAADYWVKPFLKCQMCSAHVDAKRSRVCKPCCEEKGCLETDSNGSVIVKNGDQLESSVLCGYCLLDGPHKEHESLLLLPLKTSHAVSSCGNHLSVVRDKHGADFKAGIGNLLLPADTFIEPLLKIREAAKLAGPLEGLDGIMEEYEKDIEYITGAEERKYVRHNVRFSKWKQAVFDHRSKEMLDWLREELKRTSEANDTASETSEVSSGR